jgi:hypothetical protein
MRLTSIVAFIATVLASAGVASDKVTGLTVTFTAGGKTDTRAARSCALYVPKASAPTPLIPAGAFHAKWEGDLDIPLRAEYTFSVEVRGHVKVSVNGDEILDAAGGAAAQYADKTIELRKGANRFVVSFSTDGTDDAVLQLSWASQAFPREPVPPSAWKRGAGIRVEQFPRWSLASLRFDAEDRTPQPGELTTGDTVEQIDVIRQFLRSLN